jgi:hypothetical protein
VACDLLTEVSTFPMCPLSQHLDHDPVREYLPYNIPFISGGSRRDCIISLLCRVSSPRCKGTCREV